MPLHNLQPLAVELDRALGIRSRLLGLQVVIDRREELHGRISWCELALHRCADHFLLETRRFLPVRRRESRAGWAQRAAQLHAVDREVGPVASSTFPESHVFSSSRQCETNAKACVSPQAEHRYGGQGVPVASEPQLITRARDRIVLASRREPAVRIRPRPAAGIEPHGPSS